MKSEKSLAHNFSGHRTILIAQKRNKFGREQISSSIGKKQN